MLLVLIEGNWKVNASVASTWCENFTVLGCHPVCKFHTKFCKNGHLELEREVNVHRQNQDWMT